MMRSFALFAVVLLGACTILEAQKATVMPAGEVESAIHRLPRTPPTNAEIIRDPGYAVKVAVLANRVGPGEMHNSEGRVLYILGGSGAICTGGKLMDVHEEAQDELLGSSPAGCKVEALAKGTVVSIPRGVAYQLRAPASKLTFLVVRIEDQ